jgi:hypothetical protein
VSSIIVIRDFVSTMQHALSSSRNPADASVEAVLPGVHDRLTALQNSVETTRTMLTDRTTSMCTDMKDHVNEWNRSSPLELATQFQLGRRTRKTDRE